MKCLFKKIFAIEGNIGSGKSTFLSLLEKEIPNCLVILEPVDQWQNINGENLLEQFYLNPKRWCFTFEIYSLFTKIKKLKEALVSDMEFIFIERSIFSDKAFQQVSYSYKKLDIKEMSILSELYNFFLKDYPGLNGIIYINTDLKICMERIKKRGRPEENFLTLDYLNSLREKFINIDYGCKVLNINNFDVEKNLQSMLDDIKNFININ